MGQLVVVKNLDDLEANVTALVTAGVVDNALIDAIKAETDKIDSVTTDGLAGTDNSLAYRVNEIERHLHSYESWFETAAVPDGEDHVADRVGEGSGAFQIDAGNDTWGAWVQVLGANDTPARGTNVKFDLHEMLFESTERSVVYFVQLAFGTSGAAALAAGEYTESVFVPATNLIDSGPVEIHNPRIAVGTKAWVRCMCPGQDTATMDFFIGLHEYEG